MFSQMNDFTFKNTEQVDDLYTMYTAQEIKEKLDSRGIELRTALNALIQALDATTAATNIGATAPSGLTGTNIQDLINNLSSLLQTNYYSKTELQSTAVGASGGSKIYVPALNVNSGTTLESQLSYLLSQIAGAATGSIPDNSIGLIKLATEVTDKINSSINQIGAVISGSDISNLDTTIKTSLVNAINEVFNNSSTHTNTTNGSAHKGKNILIEDTAGHFASNPKNIENVAAELFTFANNGKTAVANAVTAKGVSASPSDTFSVLAAKIGQVNTGKKVASGSGNCDWTKISESPTGDNSTWSFTLSKSLDFTPSFVIVKIYNTASTPYELYNIKSTIGNFNAGRVNGGYSYQAVFGDSSIINIITNGFNVPYVVSVGTTGTTGTVPYYSWIAVE